MGDTFGENCVILALFVLSQYTNVTDDDDRRQITYYDNSRTFTRGLARTDPARSQQNQRAVKISSALYLTLSASACWQQCPARCHNTSAWVLCLQRAVYTAQYYQRAQWIIGYLAQTSSIQARGGNCLLLEFAKYKTTRLINCVVCRKPRGGRPEYDSDHGRKFLFPYLINTVCGRGLLTYLQGQLILRKKLSKFWPPDVRF